MERAAKFTQSYHPVHWTTEHLFWCWVIEIQDEGELVALVWYHWVIDEDRIIEIHACARPDYRGRWLTKSVIDCLFGLEEELKPRPRVLKSEAWNPLLKRIWRAFGFEIRPDDFAYLNVEDERHEPQQAEASEDRGGAEEEVQSGPQQVRGPGGCETKAPSAGGP